MQTYTKIETLYNRATDGSKKLIYGDYRNDTVKFLANAVDWVWTEKVDGTNIRVYWDGHNISFGGRTDKAMIPVNLINYLNATFKTNEVEELFEQKFGEKEVILFGEGYGAGIQNGGGYIRDHNEFILFDVMIGGNYQSRECVEDIATTFGLKIVPIVGIGALKDAENFVKGNPDSVIGTCKMEGLVCRPAYELLDRCGNRIIVKIKWCDYKDLDISEDDK